ncbi:ribosome maturation factor RimM [soil metagenome]
MQDATTKYVILGHVSKSHGIQGWVNIVSYTQPAESILQYQPWLLQLKNNWQTAVVINSRVHAKGVMVQFEDCNDRNQADTYHGAVIAVPREQLPILENNNEFYWDDLVGLTVITTEGIELGKVSYILETGSNDVLVIQGGKERMIPYLPDEVIQEVNLTSKQIIVAWDPEF